MSTQTNELARFAPDYPISGTGTPADPLRPRGKKAPQKSCSEPRVDRDRSATDTLLELLNRHHNFSIPKPPVVLVIAEKTLPPIPNEKIREASNFAAELGRGFSDVITVMRAVSAHTGVSLSDLKSERRTRRIVRPRQYVYYLGHKLTAASLPQIGRQVCKDHTSCLAGIRKIEQLRKTDSKIESDLQTIAASLGGDIG